MRLKEIVDKVRPLGDRVLLRLLEKRHLAGQTAGGIIIPENSQEVHQRHMQGEIVAIGDLVGDPHLQPGMRVITGRYRHAFVDDDHEYWVTNEDNISAIIFPEEEE